MTTPASRRTARSRCSAAARCPSTPAARRCTPKRSRRRSRRTPTSWTRSSSACPTRAGVSGSSRSSSRARAMRSTRRPSTRRVRHRVAGYKAPRDILDGRPRSCARRRASPTTGGARPPRSRCSAADWRGAPVSDLATVAPSFVEMAHHIVWASSRPSTPTAGPVPDLHPIWEWDGAAAVGSRPARRRQARTSSAARTCRAATGARITTPRRRVPAEWRSTTDLHRARDPFKHVLQPLATTRIIPLDDRPRRFAALGSAVAATCRSAETAGAELITCLGG